MTENKLPSYKECVAQYPVTYSKQPFEISEDGKKVFNISRKIKGPLVIPDGVEIVELNDQYRNDELTAFIIPDSVKEIDGYFNGNFCEKLDFVRLSSNLSIIPKALFYGCKFKNIYLPNGIKEISYEVFKHSKINNLILPETIEYIYPEAFEYTDIEELILPYNLKVVCTKAFSKCSSLKKLEILSPETIIMKGAFEDCDLLASDLETLYKQYSPNNKIIGENKVKYSEDGKVLKNVPPFYCGPLKILDGTIELSSNDMFRECYGISELYFPNSFIYYNQDLPPYAETVRFPELIEGATCNAGIYLDINSKFLKNFNFPKNVTSLRINYTEIKRLSIPEGVETITLERMEHLENLDLPDSLITLERLTGAVNLKELILPEGVKSIEITSMQNLEFLELPNSLETLVLRNIPKLKSLQIPEGVKRLEIVKCNSLETINIPSGLEVIEERSLYNNQSLDKIFIPNTVTKIGAEAFKDCVNLTQIEIQGRPKPKISKSAFEGCPGWPIKK